MASPTQSLREVIDLLSAAKQGCALVCDSERLIGLFTERDVVALMASGADLDQPVSATMTRSPVTVTATDSVASAITKMSTGGYRQLPVVDDQSKPVGLFKVSCILNYFVEHFPSTIYTLPPEPGQVPPTREGA
jgi:CBS domain-containing protein